MRKLAIAAVVSGALLVQAPGASADATRIAQASSGTTEKSGAAAEKMPGKGAATSVKVRGTIDAIDKDKGTITLKGPKGRTVTLEVRDRQKLDVVKVGDPVVATYMEAVVIQALKAGRRRPA
jgi:hypothetical protein